MAGAWLVEPATGQLRAFYGPSTGRSTTAAYSSQPRTRPTPRAAAAPTACRPPTAAHSRVTTLADTRPISCPTCDNAGTREPGTGTCRVAVAAAVKEAPRRARWAMWALCGAVRPSGGLKPADGLVVPEAGC